MVRRASRRDALASLLGLAFSSHAGDATSQTGNGSPQDAAPPSHGSNILRWVPRQHWSAIRDGTTLFDARYAVQSGVDSGEPLIVPQGVLLVDGPIQLRSGVALAGAGIGLSTIKLADGAKSYVLQGTQLVGGVIRDLTVDGNRSGNDPNDPRTDKTAVFTTDSHRLIFERVEACNAKGDGFFMSTGGGASEESSRFQYLFCWAHHNGTEGGRAFTGFSGNGDDVDLIGCLSEHNIGGGFKHIGRMVGYAGCRARHNRANGFSTSAGGPPKGSPLNLFSCIAEHNGQAGVHLGKATSGADLHGLVSRFNGWSGLRLDREVRGVTLVGGEITNNSQGKATNPEHSAGVSLTPRDESQVSLKVLGTRIGDNQSRKTQRYAVAIVERTAGRAVDIHIGAGADLSGNAKGAFYRTNGEGRYLTIDSNVRGLSQTRQFAETALRGGMGRVDVRSAPMSRAEFGVGEGFSVQSSGSLDAAPEARGSLLLVIGSAEVTLLEANQLGAWHLDASAIFDSISLARLFVSVMHGERSRFQQSTITLPWGDDFDVKLVWLLSRSSEGVTTTSFTVARLNPLASPA